MRRLLPVAVVGLLLAATPARAETTTFGYTATEQAFTVPAGVTSLDVHAVGVDGRGCQARGALVDAELAVAPGQVLYVEVGGQDGFNGGGSGVLHGGNGGDATDVRSVSR